jgi:hypothetical protein
MRRIAIGGAFIIVLAVAIGGCGGAGGVLRSSPPLKPPQPPTAAEADKLLDRALQVKATCKAIAELRFHCGLSDLEGEADVELKRVGQGFAIRGCPQSGSVCTLRNPRSAHRTVAQESPSEAHAATLMNGPFGGLKHVTCARTDPSHFNCDGTFDEEGMHQTVNLDLEVVKRRFHFVNDCRVTKVWGRTVPLTCQRLAWNVNFPESEMREMSRGTFAVGAPADR